MRHITNGDVVNHKRNSKSRDVVTTKILVVDNRPVVRYGLAMFLNCEADMTVVACAGSAAEAVKAVKELPVDAAVVGMLFKDSKGVQLTQRIKVLSPHLSVFVFSMSDGRHPAQQAFEAGASGFIANDKLSEKVVCAIRQVRRGKTCLSKQLPNLFIGHQPSKLAAADGKVHRR